MYLCSETNMARSTADEHTLKRNKNNNGNNNSEYNNDNNNSEYNNDKNEKKVLGTV